VIIENMDNMHGVGKKNEYLIAIIHIIDSDRSKTTGECGILQIFG